ncbi:MAG: HAD-IIB family hydrolase [Deltaproteobacteria bacterium]|nr:HAD-IIB family hydrolase [Deltaproteobacteria bacterium]
MSEGAADLPKSVRIFCSDLDGTLIGNPEATRRFAETWSSISTELRPLLVYATGRLLPDARALVASSALPQPDYLIAGVGTEIHSARDDRVMREYSESFERDWDLPTIERVTSEVPGTVRQPPEFIGSFKSSWYLRHASGDVIAELRQRLRAAGLDVTVVYSSLRDLDILPKNASKGAALGWLAARLGVDTAELLVAGDSGNDGSMFELPGARGIVVENSHPELYELVVKRPVFCASQVMADGVVEGLLHFGLGKGRPRVPPARSAAAEHHPSLTRVLELSKIEGLTETQRNVIQQGYEQAISVLKKNITPLGFSACSMADNESIGTDLNYRSVWARDGSITLLYSLDLADPEIRVAQKQTLETLLDHLSPAGQVPANVRIDDGVPDYSGVGGVCAIDAGLWTIIAFYNYVRVTGDRELLIAYRERLARAMLWLGAHDSNNNGLLEVPEAGDWTDLFGRSYNVLYDEVLWFRTNVCYARLLEQLGEFDRATEHLRSSHRTRSQILSQFWPSTSAPADARSRSFADQQFSLGDARYLLSEITPFGFNWRCDVFGNVLAFLFGVLDVERARVAFGFMWGVGVNEPWPVANLYPPVQAGDPDWKQYYLVNLQNLPGHYHNGGVWPFIGGMWVRFVYRLGLHDLACRELFRLAEVNRSGKRFAWEFNEWVHGHTGRPMGKCFQAWSAASFVRACHELGMEPLEDRVE